MQNNTVTFYKSETYDVKIQFDNSITEDIQEYRNADGLSVIKVKQIINSKAQGYQLGAQLGPLVTKYQSILLNIPVCSGCQLAILENIALYNTKINVFNQNFETEQKQFGLFEVCQADIETLNYSIKSYNFVRLLNHLPHNLINPNSLETIIIDNFSNLPNTKVAILNHEQLQNENLNGLLAVGQGSQHQPRLIQIEYCSNPNLPKIGLIGKALTFDMGGYNIKNGLQTYTMKKDMAGASAVIGALLQIATLQLDANVTAYICCTDNLINEKAIIPGDIITYQNNLSVEVINTDAEGRLVLADGLLLAQQHSCQYLIDVATLTGAIGNALGNEMAGLFANDCQLGNLIYDKGVVSGDKVWQLPLVSEYNALLESNVADIKNVSEKPGAGAIVAALFLQKFVKDTKWAHIDMAAMGDKAYLGQKANGYAMRLLVEVVTTITES